MPPNPNATPAEQVRFIGFQDRLRGRGKSPNTLLAYTQDWLNFSAWFAKANNEPFDRDRLTAIDAADYRRHLMAANKPATVNRKLAFLRSYCEDDVILRAKLAEIQSVRQQPLAPQSLPVQAVRKLLKAVELSGSRRDIAIVYLMLYTGIRVGELVRLRKEDIILSERSGRLTIRAEVAKGHKERVVPVALAARTALQGHLDWRHDDDPMLFPGQRGALGEDGVSLLLDKYGNGLSVHPHQLRHTFAVQYLAANNNDLVGLAAILGHENLNTTRRYTLKRIEDLDAAAEKVMFV